MTWNLIGHQWTVNLLSGHITQDTLRHAYLFTGPKGVGRRTLALRFAQALNCPSRAEDGAPCRTCHTCARIEKMQHPDLLIIQSEEGSASLKVEQVRGLLSNLSLSAYEGAYKIALLLNFEEATPSAANALLKTLEEPPSQVILLLTAESADILLETVVSRCEEVRLRPVPLEAVQVGLERQWGIPADEARLLAHISGGRPGYAVHLHQNPKVLAQRGEWLDDLQRLLTAGRIERFAYVEGKYKDTENLQAHLQVWVSLWRDVMLRAAGAASPLTNLDRQTEISEIAEKLTLTTAQRVVERLEKTQYLLDHSANTRLTLEVLMLDLPRL